MTRLRRFIHVVPINDTSEHVLSRDCWCEPRVESRHPDTGEPYESDMVIHSSEDCREAVERLLGEGVEASKRWATVETTEVTSG